VNVPVERECRNVRRNEPRGHVPRVLGPGFASPGGFWVTRSRVGRSAADHSGAPECPFGPTADSRVAPPCAAGRRYRIAGVWSVFCVRLTIPAGLPTCAASTPFGVPASFRLRPRTRGFEHAPPRAPADDSPLSCGRSSTSSLRPVRGPVQRAIVPALRRGRLSPTVRGGKAQPLAGKRVLSICGRGAPRSRPAMQSAAGGAGAGWANAFWARHGWSVAARVSGL
jgi:hypothetical protein